MLPNDAFYPVPFANGSSLRNVLPLFMPFFELMDKEWHFKSTLEVVEVRRSFIATSCYLMAAKVASILANIDEEQHQNQPLQNSEPFPYTFEGWLQCVLCRALYSKFLLLVWHRLNLLIFRACMLQVIYYVSCCGGGPLGKLCVWESSLIFCKHIRFVFRFCVKASRAMDRHLLCLTTQPRIKTKQSKIQHKTYDLPLPPKLNQQS